MNILICSDGTPEAGNALRFASMLAVACRGRITLLGVAETPTARVELEAILERDRAALAQGGVPCEVTIREGEPTREIVKLSDCDPAPDLVIVGARRKSGAGRYWRSARVYKLIRVVRPPVLVVMGRREKLTRILLCSGGRQYIAPAVGVTAALATGTGAAVTLLHIVAEAPAMYAQLAAMHETTEQVLDSETELGQHLRDERARLQTAGVTVQVRVRQGQILHELAEEIREGDYDMVVTGAALANSPLRRFIMGDVTREIVNRVGCPVLVVRSRPDGAAPEPPRPRRTWRFPWKGI